MSLALLCPEQPEPDEQRAQKVFDQMVVGYQTLLAARNCGQAWIDNSGRFVRYLQKQLGWPWLWETAAWEKRQSDRRQDGITLGTRRTEQTMVEGFTRYLTDPEYGWPEVCHAFFGLYPRCLITESNRILHKESIESLITVRPATRNEYQQLVDVIDAHVALRAEHGKGAISAYRDAMFIKMSYAYGLRRSETCELRLCDFSRNIHLPAFGDFGALTVRNGKAKPRGSARRRTVYTTRLMAWIVPELIRYVDEVRTLYGAAAHDDHLFPSDQAAQISPNYA